MKLILGCAQFGMAYGVANKSGSYVDNNELASILNKANLSGITVLDTASSYGSSEKRLGRLIAGRFNVITKIPSAPGTCKDIFGWTISEIEKSIKKLNVVSLEAVLIHNSAELFSTNGGKIYGALNFSQKNGLLKKIGISVYSPEEFLRVNGVYDFNIVQAPINIFDRRIIGSSYLNIMHQKKIELHARSIFLQGLLLMEIKNLPNYFMPWMDYFKKWRIWLNDTQLTPLNACLRFVHKLPRLEKMVIGVQGSSQIDQIISEMENLNGNMIIPKFIDNEEDNLGLIDPRQWKI
jgi:aryl-alcohol dehydrogenase-like predicted oxidoreductase